MDANAYPILLAANIARALWAVAKHAGPELRRAALRVLPDGSARWEATDGWAMVLLDLPPKAERPLEGVWILDAASMERAAVMPPKWRDGSELNVRLMPDAGPPGWPDVQALLRTLTPATSGEPPAGWSSRVLALPDAVATALALGKRDGDRVWTYEPMATNPDGMGTPLDPVRMRLQSREVGNLAAVWMLVMPCRLSW